MKRVRDYMKKRRITFVYLSQKMSCSPVYLSQVFGNHEKPSTRFKHLLITVLKEMAAEKIEYAKKDLNELDLLGKEVLAEKTNTIKKQNRGKVS